LLVFDSLSTYGLQFMIYLDCGKMPDKVTISYDGRQLIPGRTCLESNIHPGAVLKTHDPEVVRKPVIYLFPPVNISATVVLAVHPQCKYILSI
jgi:hypothetical protein